MIVLRCIDAEVPTAVIANLETLALRIEMLVVPLVLQLVGGRIEVKHVIVDMDPIAGG